MDEKRYRDIVLVLAVAALIVSDTPFDSFRDVLSNEGIWDDLSNLRSWGWVPGLALGITSLSLTGRIKRHDKTLIRIFSLLAIALSLLWAIPALKIMMR